MYICYKCQLHKKKKRIPLYNLLINCISARSAPQVLSIKVEFTFLFLNFLITGLCISSVNSLFDIFLLFIADLFRIARVAKISDCASKFFHQKMYKPLKQYPFDIHHILDF